MKTIKYVGFFFLFAVIMIAISATSGSIEPVQPNLITIQTEKTHDISGAWNSSIDVIFQINQVGERFYWQHPESGNQASGSIHGEELSAVWIVRETSQPVTGRVTEFDSSGRPIRIEWSNGVFFFRGSKPKMVSPIQGWCCKNGNVYAATITECNKQSGKFFTKREHAEEVCAKEYPQEGWCCFEGQVFPSKRDACIEKGGQFFPTRAQTEEFCQAKFPEPEQGFCCREGEIFETSIDECLEKGGRFFRTMAEAEEHCRGEHPAEGWCCFEGEVFPSRRDVCLERGGHFFPLREQAEEFCQEKLPEPEQGFCCREGEIFETSIDECLEKGGRFFRTMEEAEKFCGKERPQHGWCCRDGQVFPAASEDCCREVGGVYFVSREEAEEFCREKEAPKDEYFFYEEYPGWNMPELAVSSLMVEPERANPGDTVRLNATVSNLGTGDTNWARLILWVDGKEIAREAVEPLPPFGVMEITAAWTANGPGRHPVIAELEIGQDDFDGNPENNSRRATARVSGEETPVPELEIKIPDSFRYQLAAGESTNIPVNFHNPSFAHLRDIPVHFYVDQEHMENGMIEDLPSGEQRELVFHWENVEPGEHMISVQMDLPDEFPDYIKQGVKGMHIRVPDSTSLYDVAQKNKWSPVGKATLHNGDVGRIVDFAFHPNDLETMYAVSWEDQGSVLSAAGIWKTTNGGGYWSPIGDKLGTMAMSCVTVDSKTPICVYVGTKDYGIFKSRDSGKSWNSFIGPIVTGNLVTELIVRSEPGKTSPRVVVYAATRNGLWRYKSDDPWSKTSASSEWDRIKQGVITDLDVHPTNRSIVYASVEGEGLFRTKNGITAKPEITKGNHDWTKVGTGLPTSSVWNALKIDIFKANPKYIYAGVRKPKTGFELGIYRSDNGGDTFKPLVEYPVGYLAGGIYNPYVRVHQNLLDTVYFGGVVLYKWSTSDPPPGKKSWTYVVDLRRCDMKELKFLPSPSSDFYVACDQGMFRCTATTKPKKDYKKHKKYGTAGDTVAPRNNNLRVTQFYDFDVGTSGLPEIIGGTQDNGTVLFKLWDGKPGWRMVESTGYGDGYYSLIAPSNNKVMYVQMQDLESTKRSGNSGKDWHNIAANKGLPTRFGSAGYIVVDPNYPNTVLAAGTSGDPKQGGQVYATKNADLETNCTWSGKGPIGKAVKGAVTRIAIQPTTTHWFAGTSKGQIWHTSIKATGTWNLIDSHPTEASISSMAFSPKDDAVLYVLYAWGDPYMRVQRLQFTPSGGWNGTWITDNLDVLTRPRVICGDGFRSDVAYVGTEHGVFRWDGTKPTYGSWQLYSDGLPLTTVVDLKVGPKNMLYAATKGRGVWHVITGH